MSGPAPTRDSALDGVRGLAIALVLWHHLVEFFLPLPSLSPLGLLRVAGNLSWSGVDLFFVLSGYFIGGILLDRHHSPHFARTFYVRRALRILPLYFVTLAAIFAAITFGVPGSYHEFSPWVYLLFLGNFAIAHAGTWDWFGLSVLWSLAVEEQFYLAAPWIVRAVSGRHLPQFALALVGLAWLLRVGLTFLFPEHELAAHVLTPLRMDTLALGVLIAWAVRSESARPWLAHLGRQWPRWIAACALVFLGLSLLRMPEGSRLACVAGYSLLALVYALLVIVVASTRPPALNRFLSARPLTHLGRHAYFIYLWHQLLGLGLIHWLGGRDFQLRSFLDASLVLAAIAVTWAAAVVSMRWFEGPLIARGQRCAY